MADKDDNVVSIKDHLKNNPQEEDYGEEVCVIQCPYCRGVEWAVCQEEESAGISYLICVSEECDGDSYIEINEGLPAEEVVHLDGE